MKQMNLIKIIIIVALIAGELIVWNSPTDHTPYEGGGINGTYASRVVSILGIKGIEWPNLEPEVTPEESAQVEQGQEPKQEQEPEQEIQGPEKETPQVSAKKAVENGLLILVNKGNFLEEDYVPADLKAVTYYAENRSAASRFMRGEAADQFNNMAGAAREAGFEIVMTTAYRSYSFQSALYSNNVGQYGQTEADKFSAKPGYSEHQTGLAVDVSSPSVGYALTEGFDATPEWKWLSENAGRFGFILRYPKDKTEITGYMYEAWHFRYVGLDAAKMMNDENITLEEYSNKYLTI